MSVALVRLDSRLVHGQVVESWLPYLEVSLIMVVDAEAAGSPLAQAAMQMALPPGVGLSVHPPETVDWAEALEAEGRVLILTATFADVLEIDRGLGLAARGIPLNVGVVQHEADRRPILPGVYLAEAEVALLAGLAERGVKIEVRGLPSQPPLGVGDVRARFLKAG